MKTRLAELSFAYHACVSFFYAFSGNERKYFSHIAKAEVAQERIKRSHDKRTL